MKDYFNSFESLYLDIQTTQYNWFMSTLKTDFPDSTKTRAASDYRKSENDVRVLDSLVRTADTTQKLYRVSYIIRAKTDQNSIEGHWKKFLQKDDLSLINIDVKKFMN